MSAITNLPRDRCGDGADPPRGEWFNFDFGAPLMHCRPIYEYYVEPHPTNQLSPSPNDGQAGRQLADSNLGRFAGSSAGAVVVLSRQPAGPILQNGVGASGSTRVF